MNVRTGIASVLAALTLAAAPALSAELVSRNYVGTNSANGGSGCLELSADGRFGVFTSQASNLVAVDTNGGAQANDTFVVNLKTGAKQLVSLNRLGSDSGNAASYCGLISADGRHVVFSSDATDLVAGTAGTGTQIFARDRQTGTTQLVTINAAGTGGANGQSVLHELTPDGRFVVFRSNATDLTTLTDGNGDLDLFVRDLQTGTTILVSVNAAGTGTGNAYSNPGTISQDGRYVAFESSATDLGPPGPYFSSQIFRRDLQSATTILVSVNSAGTAPANLGSSGGLITPDGRFVVFASYASDLTPNDTDFGRDLFVRDVQSGTTTLVSVNAAGTGSANGDTPGGRATPDGRYVAFFSTADNLHPLDTDSETDAYRRDMQNGVTTLVSVNATGTASGNNLSFLSNITDDGRLVLFVSRATDLEAVAPTTVTENIYLRDLQTQTTTLISTNAAGTNGGNASSYGSVPSMAGGGRIVAFSSLASNLAPLDTNGTYDVFVFRGRMAPVSLAVDPAGNGVMEPGEVVAVETTWRNDTGLSVDVGGGVGGSFTGPLPATYSFTDGASGYPQFSAKTVHGCAEAGDCFSLSATPSGPRPTQHWDATFVETLGSGDKATWTIHIGESFSDVAPSAPFYRFIEGMFHNGVTAGCGNGMFCPNQSATRAAAAVFALVGREGFGYVPPACVAGQETFADVPAGSSFCRWIEEFARRGITSGCGGGNYCPNSPVTRGQMAVLLLRTKDGATNVPPACVAGSEMFSDVPASNGFCRWIEEFARRGITSGCGGGNYCPNSPTTRGQMSVFIVRTFGLEAAGGAP